MTEINENKNHTGEYQRVKQVIHISHTGRGPLGRPADGAAQHAGTGSARLCTGAGSGKPLAHQRDEREPVGRGAIRLRLRHPDHSGGRRR